jgi:hypothetical protein
MVLMSLRLVAPLSLVLQLARERLAINKRTPALARRLLAILLGKAPVARGKCAVLRRLRASLHRAPACAGGAHHAFRAAALLVVVLRGGVALRHCSISRLGGGVSRHRRDIAVVGDRIMALGGLQARARAVPTLICGVLACSAARLVRYRVGAGGKIAIVCGSIAIGGRLVAVGARLIARGMCLISIGECLIALRRRLVAVCDRLVALGERLLVLEHR